MKDIVDRIKAYKVAGEEGFRVPSLPEEHYELSSSLNWIQEIVGEEETRRINTDYVVEIIWDLEYKAPEEEEEELPLFPEEPQNIGTSTGGIDI